MAGEVVSKLYHAWTLPWPGAGCNVNHQYAPGRGGRRYLTPAAEAYRFTVQMAVAGSPWKPPAKAPLALTLELHPPDLRRRDIDGPGKLLTDALFDALGEDDARVVHLEVWKHPPCKENPRVEVRLAAVMGFGEQVGETP